jgi:hypothetical protein
MDRFCEVTSLDESRELLHHKGQILLADHAQSYILLSCLEDEMNGKVGDACRLGEGTYKWTCVSDLIRPMRPCVLCSFTDAA